MSYRARNDHQKKIKNNPKPTKNVTSNYEIFRKRRNKVKTSKKESKTGLIGFLKKLVQLFLIIIVPIEGLLFTLFEAIIHSANFIKTNGIFLFIVIWSIPVLILILITFLLYGSYIIKDNKILKRFRIITSIISAIVLISLIHFSYQDSRKTSLTIFSENPIYQIELESRNHKITYYKYEPERIERDKFVLNQRIPFGNYNITVIFTSEPNQFFTRTFRTRTDSLVIF